jgi:hypothetical protein
MAKVKILITCPSFHTLLLSNFKFYVLYGIDFKIFIFILKEILFFIIYFCCTCSFLNHNDNTQKKNEDK